VTITGGEVSLYSNLAETLLVPVRKKGFKIKIDTYGPEPERVQQWIDAGLVQALGIDVKGPWSKYPEILKRSFDQSHLLRIRRWIRYLVEQELACLSNGLMVEFRTTVHPSLISIQDIFQTAEQIRGASLYVLQNYRPVPGCDESLQRTPSYSLQQLREVAHTIQQKGIIKRCFVRGFEQDALDTESKKACAS
jgi:pyruvate formate lyase activating enzyme